MEQTKREEKIVSGMMDTLSKIRKTVPMNTGTRVHKDKTKYDKQERQKSKSDLRRMAGTWSLPVNNTSVHMIVKLVKDLRNGNARHPNEITDILYPILGDDDLSDIIEGHEKYYLKLCSEAIVRRIKEFAAQSPDSFKDPRAHANLVLLSKQL